MSHGTQFSGPNQINHVYSMDACKRVWFAWSLTTLIQRQRWLSACKQGSPLHSQGRTKSLMPKPEQTILRDGTHKYVGIIRYIIHNGLSIRRFSIYNSNVTFLSAVWRLSDDSGSGLIKFQALGICAPGVIILEYEPATVTRIASLSLPFYSDELLGLENWEGKIQLFLYILSRFFLIKSMYFWFVK